MNSNVAVSIVNYGAPSQLMSCIESLKDAHSNTNGCLLKIFILDNFYTESNQRKLERVLANDDFTVLKLNPRNEGFAAGHNYNLHDICGQNFDYIWLLNSDCIVEESSLSELLKSAKYHGQDTLLGATLLDLGSRQVQVAGGCHYYPWLTINTDCGRGKRFSQLPEEAAYTFDYISGASLFFHQTLLRQLKPLDEVVGKQRILNDTFFLYFEELDLAHRLPTNAQMKWCKQALVFHEEGGTTGGSGNQDSKISVYHSTLSAFKFTAIYHPHALWFAVPFRLIAKGAQLLVTRQTVLLRDLCRAFRDFRQWQKRKQ